MVHYIEYCCCLLDIESVEPNTGSMAGGTWITIRGKHFGVLKDNIEVKVAGIPCKVNTLDDRKIVCVTGEVKESNVDGDIFPGRSDMNP